MLLPSTLAPVAGVNHPVTAVVGDHAEVARRDLENVGATSALEAGGEGGGAGGDALVDGVGPVMVLRMTRTPLSRTLDSFDDICAEAENLWRGWRCWTGANVFRGQIEDVLMRLDEFVKDIRRT